MILNEIGKILWGSLRKLFGSRRSIQGLILVFLGYALMFILIVMDVRSAETDRLIRVVIVLIPLIAVLMGLGYLTYGYLEGRVLKDEAKEPINGNLQTKEELDSKLTRLFDGLRNDQDRGREETVSLINDLRNQLELQDGAYLDRSQKAEISNLLKETISEHVNQDFFKHLKDNISSTLTYEKRGARNAFEMDFRFIRSRLNREIEKLSRKANVNLVIGSLTTIVALGALGYIVLQSQDSFVDLTQMLFHYIPRISLIIFIEVFAFFFLRLYKLNLNDMKYIQNELTTIELKLVSLSVAINFGKDIDVSSITKELSKTERNFILKKGETTVELEKSRIGKAGIREILNSITDISKRQK